MECPKFIETLRDQSHNKTTLTDSDRMADLFQNLDSEGKKAVEGIHSYPTALRTLKHQFGTANSVEGCSILLAWWLFWAAMHFILFVLLLFCNVNSI